MPSRKVKEYEAALDKVKDWDTFLLRESGLPGPRANLELAEAVANRGDRARFERWLTIEAKRAPANSQLEFLPLCGVIGLGKLIADGEKAWLATLRRSASDPRWRIREGVAIALQRVGHADMEFLLREMERWTGGNRLEQRAVVAALAEPPLLKNIADVRRVLALLDRITLSVAEANDRREDEFRVLRQTLGYGWSVAACPFPEAGLPAMEKWMRSKDPDVGWIMKENLKKSRLARTDARWVKRWQARLEDDSAAKAG